MHYQISYWLTRWSVWCGLPTSSRRLHWRWAGKIYYMSLLVLVYVSSLLVCLGSTLLIFKAFNVGEMHTLISWTGAWLLILLLILLLIFCTTLTHITAQALYCYTRWTGRSKPAVDRLFNTHITTQALYSLYYSLLLFTTLYYFTTHITRDEQADLSHESERSPVCYSLLLLTTLY